MPKACDSLAPLRDIQNKAESLVSKMDAAVFNRLGVLATDEVEPWKATFEMDMREKIEEYRLKTLAQLQLHSQRARTLHAPIRLDEGYTGIVRKLTVLNIEFEKLFDIFERCLLMVAEDDPRREYLQDEMSTIQSNIAMVREGEKELQDQFPALKRALQFLVLPEAQFEAFVEPLRLQPDSVDLSLLNPKLIRLAKFWRRRHEWFEEIQEVLADAADKWVDQQVTPNRQCKVLREMQKLYRQLQAQDDKQDNLLTDIEGYREWAIEAPIYLTHDGLGTIEVCQLLAALKEYKDVSQTSGMFLMLDLLLTKVSTYVLDLEAIMGM